MARLFDGERIIRFLAEEHGRPVRARELAKLMGVPEIEYGEFRAALRDLRAKGRIVRLKRGRIAPPDALNLVTGTVVTRRGGHLFCRVDGRGLLEGDVFIRPRERLTALAEDRVMVRLHPDRDGPSQEGEIIKIIERGTKPILGIFRRSQHFASVVPDSPHPLREIYIAPNATKGAEIGQQVMVQITDWEFPDQTPTGKITKVLGFPDEPGVDMERIIASYQLPQSFPPAVMAEVRAFSPDIQKSDLEGRDDFRDLVTFTIDPADAKDHDDAVSLEHLGTGWRLGVHIADVTRYVPEGSALDHEAFERGTSVYLVDRVIPMLPVRLSNNLCSLKPRVDRLTVSCMIDLSDDGQMKNYRFCRSVIRSQAKLSYGDVSEYFYKGQINRTVKPFLELLDDMRDVSQALRARRFANGGLDLIAPEYKVFLDEEGHPIRIELRKSDHAHQLVEEFMLIANQCAAHRFLRKELPGLYRVHAPPSQEKMDELAGFVTTLGYKLSSKGGVTSLKLGRLLQQVKDDPRRDMIHMVVLRSLMKAAYQPDNIGHFGLAFPHYAHFTSPIRRYPDLWIHRHILKILSGKWTVAEQNKAREALPDIGKKTSERERAAEEAERESVRIKQLEYLNAHIGDEFEGRISGFLEFGFFVTLQGVGTDGLVRFSGIDDDYYVWERDKWRVRGRRSGRTFTLGDSVKVRLIKTNAEKMEIDLVMSESFEPRSRSRGRVERPSGGQRR